MILSHFDPEGKAVYREQVYHEELWRAIDKEQGGNTTTAEQFDYEEFMKYIQWAHAEIQVALTIVDRLLEDRSGIASSSADRSRLTLAMAEERVEQQSLIDTIISKSSYKPTSDGPKHQERLLALARTIRERGKVEQHSSKTFLEPLGQIGWPVLLADRSTWMVDYDPLRLLYNHRMIGRKDVGMAEIVVGEGKLEFKSSTITWLTLKYNGYIIQVGPELSEKVASMSEAMTEPLIASWNRELLMHQCGLVEQLVFQQILAEASKSRIGRVVLEQSDSFSFILAGSLQYSLQFSLEAEHKQESACNAGRKALLSLLAAYDASRGEKCGFEEAIEILTSDWSNN